MPNTPSTSFIPKQGPIRRPKQSATRQVHLLSVISYVVFASTLVASAGVFFYGRHVEKQMTQKVGELDAAIASFSEENMNQVREFNVRLKQTRERIENSASVFAIFEALEDATVQKVTVDNLAISRSGDEKLTLTADINTDSFDSSLFQRGVLERSEVVESVAIKDLEIVEESSEDDVIPQSGVTFKAELGIPLSAVPHVPRMIPVESSPIPFEFSSTSASSTPAVDTVEVVPPTNIPTI